MSMTPDEARAVKREPIHAGDQRVFYCEIQQEYEPPEKRLRRFTGQTVTVVRNLTRDEYDGPGPDDEDEGFEISRVFLVRAEDGTEFPAHVEELNGWDRDLGQYFNPDATYGPNRETWPLQNERTRPTVKRDRTVVILTPVVSVNIENGEPTDVSFDWSDSWENGAMDGTLYDENNEPMRPATEAEINAAVRAARAKHKEN